ncbi:MAG: AIR synthase family protein [Nitrososphaerales archaeon]
MRKLSPLPEGKLPIDALAQVLSSISSRKLVIAPQIGVDVGITRSQGKYIVSSSDPITGTEKRLAWHAVNVSANDVATSGIMPDTINVVAMFPRNTNTSEIRSFMKEIDKTARKLDIAVAGGHTEITPYLTRPIIVITAFGSGDRFITSAGAKRDDSILMTKTAGIEGTSILAGLPGVQSLVSKKVLSRGKNLLTRISILEEARTAFDSGVVNAMHDVTEGGVIGAALEMSMASKLGFELNVDSIPVDDCTRKICSSIKVDPLRLLSSGALLIACPAKFGPRVTSLLERKHIECSMIGRFLARRQDRILVVNEQRNKLEEASVQDELWQSLKKYSTKYV